VVKATECFSILPFISVNSVITKYGNTELFLHPYLLCFSPPKMLSVEYGGKRKKSKANFTQKIRGELLNFFLYLFVGIVVVLV